MSDPVFLDVEDVLLIHEELPKYGGSPGLRDRGLLESAVAMARATVGGLRESRAHRIRIAQP